MFGILNVNKPVSWTSRDVVNRVQRFVRTAKVGHAGTLDPLATGVLVICTGPATRLISYVQEMPKEYQATFLLGLSSDSHDVETEIRQLPAPPEPKLAEIEQKLPDFLGQIDQRPPAFSAIKIAGERAYKLARQGQPVKLEPRRVNVYGLEITEYDYPTLKITIRCGSGTYVRSLGRDLAESLETSAVMSALRRTAIGDFRYEDALDILQLTKENIASRLLPPNCAVRHLPQMTLSGQQIEEVSQGRQISAAGMQVPEASRIVPDRHDSIPGRTPHHLEVPAEVAALDETGNLIAILAEKHAGMLGPVRNFPSSG